MASHNPSRLTADEVLRRYREEELPDFCGEPLVSVNQRGLFGDFAIHVASGRGNLEEIKALVEGGADVKVIGERGETPLHLAVGLNQLESARLLLDFGASVRAKNDDGRTPLDIARLMGHVELIALLSDVTDGGLVP